MTGREHEASDGTATPGRTWARGDVVVLRNVKDADPGHHEPHVGYAHTARVIADGDLVVLYQPPKTLHMERSGERGGPRGRNMVRGGWDGSHSEREWRGDGVVYLHRPSEPWSVWRWVDADGVWSTHFYVNFERPWRRTRLGFDTDDWVLDLIVTGPEHDVTVKDADELEWCVAAGTISAEQAELARRSAEEMTEVAARGGWPFDADWSAWLPDARWSAEPLPTGWADIE
ncbi:YgaC family protein [Planctomonas sp. JC2975]|uniref:DUF402 domain-containing protein n=1 Tax=Planctomonas sp. JC2975 TaxID=2729626 RepID=UPI00147651BB|nr:DUF402 domain-containing protein [Planctomonas sp. JC2975]NNC12391.1 YgaC family protein [Planctomonas sp. JC2975]